MSSLSMVFFSTVPFASDVAELHANGLRILFFPIDANGFAYVSSIHLSYRFSLQDSSIWVEREIYDNVTSLLSLTMRVNHRVADKGSSMWDLCAGQYKVYGLPSPSTNLSMETRTPPHSPVSTFDTPHVVKVKVEFGLHTIIHLSDSSDGDEPPYPLPFSSHPHPSSVPTLLPLLTLHTLPNPPIPFSNVYTLASMPSRKNILKKINYDTLQIEEVDFMPPLFYDNRMFVLPQVGASSSHTKAKFIDGMEKRYDGHV